MIELIIALLFNLGISFGSGGQSSTGGTILVTDVTTGAVYTFGIGSTGGVGNGVVKNTVLSYNLYRNPDGTYYLSRK
jgi:hypothetical protein